MLTVTIHRTFHATGDPVLINEKMDHVARELEEDMERLGYAGNTITLKVKLDTFEGMYPVLQLCPPGNLTHLVRSRAKTVHKPVRTYDEFMAVSINSFKSVRMAKEL